MKKKPDKGKAGKLTPKQERFCQEYIIDLNGTQAAIRAGYSEKTAQEIAAQNLSKLIIKSKIAELRKKIALSLEIKAEDIGNEIRKIAESNIQDFIGDGNEVMDISKIKREKAAAVQSIKTTVTYSGKGEFQEKHITTEIKLYDKVKGNELLGKHVGFFEKDNSQKTPKEINLNHQLSNLSDAELRTLAKLQSKSGTSKKKPN